MEVNSSKRKIVAQILKVASWVLFAIFAFVFIWGLLFTIPIVVYAAQGNSAANGGGLFLLFGVVLLFVSTIPLTLGTVAWVIASMIRKGLAASQPTQTASAEGQNPKAIHPQVSSN